MQQLSDMLAELTGETLIRPFSTAEFHDRVESLLAKHGSQGRPDSTREQADLHNWVLRYALRMSEMTYRRWNDPAPEASDELKQRFKEAVEPYPSTNDDFHQGAVDSASSLRRALKIHSTLQGQGPVLFLGDDDACSIALALLGDYTITAADIDSTILDWIRRSSQRIGVDIEVSLADVRNPPPAFRDKYLAVVTDPSSDWALAQCFLRASRFSLQRGGWLFWADHPDLNFAYEKLVEFSHQLGFETLEVLENWHSYSPVVYNDSTARWFGFPPEFFQRLAAVISIWSHLHVTRLRVLN